MSAPHLSLASCALLLVAQDRQLGLDFAARAGEREVRFEELDELLVWRHGRSPDGRAALRQLLELSVLQELGAQAGLSVSEEALQRRMGELDREIRASGVEGGLAEYLRDSEVDAATFRRYLELAILHEDLTRRALDRPAEEPVSGEEQTAWLESVLEARGYEELPHPWADGVVAKSGTLVLRREDLARHLRTAVPRAEVRDACYEILLEREARARMPDLADEALERAVEAELERRGAEARSDPRFQGAAYEQLLDAQGLSLEALRRDPALRAAALAHAWVDRTWDDDGLRRVYEDERELFDGVYGEALELYAIHKRAARYKNDLNPRTFEEAEAELVALKGEIARAGDFQRLAALHSEDPSTRPQGGRIGFVSRSTPTVPPPIRAAVFDEVDAERARGTTDAVIGRVLGPIRVTGGVVLVSIAARRPAPAWEEMASYVHRELRRRFLEETLARESVVTWLD